MAVLSVQDEFQSGDNVTATNLNNLVKDASFNADTTDNSTLEVHTTGYLKVKDLGVDTQHLADGAVETDKIGNDQVTYDKMQDVAALSVIGNNTNATATPAAISIDDLKDNISNATQTADGLMSSADKNKLDGIEAGAEVNVQSDWNQTDDTADDFIENKPTIPTNVSDLTNDTGFTTNEGTVVSIASGTGLTGGPITTAGTLSLASIANLRALGNVSGGTAAPTSVEIKDEDNMASNSATALATQQSIKAYVDSQVVAQLQAKASFQGVSGVTRNTNAETNIASVTRTGTGRYTVTFTNAVSDPVVSLAVGWLNGTYRDRTSYLLKNSSGTTVYSGSVTSIDITTLDAGGVRDANLVQLLVF